MLILHRRPGEDIEIELEDGRMITVRLLGIDRGQARYGIDAPRSIKVDRAEIAARKRRERLGDAIGNVACEAVA